MFHSREPGVSGNFRGRIKGAKYRFPLHRETREEATGQSERAWGEISKAGWLAACANN